jgi:hypothetical protein
MNKDGESLCLEQDEVFEFERVFSHLYDAGRNINIIQHVDKIFLKSWMKYDKSILSEANQKDMNEIFKKGEYVSLEYNLNPIAIMVRLRNNPKLLNYINTHHCSLSEAIDKTEQSHLWA